VASVREAADVLAVVPAPSPWLPPLPEHVAVESLRPAATTGRRVVPLGLTDRPSDQLQEALVWDLAAPGHWAAIGGAGSGRTSFLRLVAREAAQVLGPAQLHVYAVDGSRGELHDLTMLPHTGAVVPRDDHGRLERLIRRLEAEVARRQQLLAGQGVRPHTNHGMGAAAAAQQDGSAGSPPRDGADPPALATMLLLVDDWDLVTRDLDAVDHGVLTERLVRLLREGAAVGLRAAVAGDRSLLLGATAALFAERLVLRLADPADAVLAGLSRFALPDLRAPGRAVLSSDGALVQLAREPQGHLGCADVGAGAAEVVTDGGAAAPVLTPDTGPLLIEPLPRHVALDDLLAGEQGRAAHPGDVTTGHVTTGRVTVGLGGDDVRPVGLDPRLDGPLWLVAGPSRSGKSTALRTLGESLLHSGHPVAVVSGRSGPLDELRRRAGVACFAAPDDVDALVAAHRAEPGLAVVVDDADQVIDTPVEPVLRDLVREARQGRGLVVCAAGTQTLLTQYRGPAVEVARGQTGLLLGPRGLADGELFGLSGTRRLAPPDRVPGRGLLVTSGETLDVQVAMSSSGVRGARQAAGLTSG
jgi:S-DNA-T family DNA segregation ATPase FtsK/SpoIIIE